jgi:hypothetical protein
MPQALNLQTVIAFVWDFDKTLSPGYMQEPLFKEYQIDGGQFWREVNGLVEHYRRRGLRVSKDTAYLGHLLSYVRDGRLPGLTNSKLRELGSQRSNRSSIYRMAVIRADGRHASFRRV